jgi:hypothetical protein
MGRYGRSPSLRPSGRRIPSFNGSGCVLGCILEVKFSPTGDGAGGAWRDDPSSTPCKKRVCKELQQVDRLRSGDGVFHLADVPRQVVNLTSCSRLLPPATPLFRVARRGASLPGRWSGHLPMTVFPGDGNSGIGPLLLSDKSGKVAKRRTPTSARRRYRARPEAQRSAPATAGCQRMAGCPHARSSCRPGLPQRRHRSLPCLKFRARNSRHFGGVAPAFVVSGHRVAEDLPPSQSVRLRRAV